MELIWDLWNGSSKLIHSKRKSCSGKPSVKKKVLVGKLSFRSFFVFQEFTWGFFKEQLVPEFLHICTFFICSQQLWRVVPKACRRDCLSLRNRSTNSVQPNDLRSFDKCTHTSKYFHPRVGPYWQLLDRSMLVLFWFSALFFDLQKGCALFSSPFLRPAVNTLHRAQSFWKQAAFQHGLRGRRLCFVFGWLCMDVQIRVLVSSRLRACLCTSSQAENQTDTGRAANKPELFLKQHKNRGKRQGDENPFQMN